MGLGGRLLSIDPSWPGRSERRGLRARLEAWIDSSWAWRARVAVAARRLGGHGWDSDGCVVHCRPREDEDHMRPRGPGPASSSEDRRSTRVTQRTACRRDDRFLNLGGSSSRRRTSLVCPRILPACRTEAGNPLPAGIPSSPSQPVVGIAMPDDKRPSLRFEMIFMPENDPLYQSCQLSGTSPSPGYG